MGSGDEDPGSKNATVRDTILTFKAEPKFCAMSSTSPKIENASWGKVQVEGYEERFKDVKLFPGGAKEWDWNETGTSHNPGIQQADLQDLIRNGAEKIILSQGYWKMLKVPEETKRALEEQGIEVEVLPTGRAVEAYDQAVSKSEANVGALIHSTC